MGFAQKFGPVISYLRFAEQPGALHQVRTDAGSADAMVAGDLVVSSSPKASATYRAGMRAVANLAEMPTGDIVRRRDGDLAIPRRLAALETVAGAGMVGAADANVLAEA
jgi:indolepyruvate ferredoxin oxidoreductase